MRGGADREARATAVVAVRKIAKSRRGEISSNRKNGLKWNDNDAEDGNKGFFVSSPAGNNDEDISDVKVV